MSWKCQSTHLLYRPFVAAALLLSLSSCAGTGGYDRRVDGLTGTDPRQDVPEYVRNLPKSATGNMPEYTVFGKRYRVLDTAANFSQQGIASWYGKRFHGRKTSSGEVYDMNAMTAAHKSLPLPTYVRVTNLDNNRSVVVKVNDRGPFVGKRIIDLSLAAAMELNMAAQGTANVLIEALSTHLVAENDYESDTNSNQSVVQSFGQQQADKKLTAPEVVEPALAAVPTQESATVIEQFESEIEPIPKGELLQSADDVSKELVSEIEDLDRADGGGYVELVAQTAEADDQLINVPNVETPGEVEQNASIEQVVNDNMLPTNDGALLQADDSYFIQLGAFGHAPNAVALVADVVQKTGLTAFVEKDDQQDLYRVKIGPFEKGDSLDTAMTELTNIGIDGYAKPALTR